jgi:hypothetical protein
MDLCMRLAPIKMDPYERLINLAHEIQRLTLR